MPNNPVIVSGAVIVVSVAVAVSSTPSEPALEDGVDRALPRLRSLCMNPLKPASLPMMCAVVSL